MDGRGVLLHPIQRHLRSIPICCREGPRMYIEGCIDVSQNVRQNQLSTPNRFS